jgi:hypothetical protein
MPTDPPSLETTYFDEQIAIAADIGAPGKKTFSGVHNLSGSYYYDGKIDFSQNAIINVTGIATVVATSNVEVQNNVSFGDHFNLIADGDVEIDNNVEIGRFGVWYSSEGFEIANNAEVGDTHVGEGTQFLTPGDFILGNNCSFDGLIYSGGMVELGNNTNFSGLLICDWLASVGENSSISINPDVLDWDSVTAIDAGEGVGHTDVTDWDEVY